MEYVIAGAVLLSLFLLWRADVYVRHLLEENEALWEALFRHEHIKVPVDSKGRD